MRVRSYAKVNLGLEVIRKRDDHYHDIRTLFQSIDLYDTLEFQLVPANEIILSGTDNSIPWGEDNLIHKAVLALKSRSGFSQGVAISTVKNIPAGRGLGGGSSNAAMTLYALNKLWGLQYGIEELEELGSRVGADVPYFLKGGLCLGTERGDRLECLPDIPLCYGVLIPGNFSVSTASVYKNIPVTLTSHEKDSKITQFLISRDFSELKNELEETVFYLYPQIKTTKTFIQDKGSVLTLVSGSGAAVFGLFSDKAETQRVCDEIRKEHTVFLFKTVSREAYWKGVDAGV